jgi:large subunit ribosomal protein L28
MAKHCEICGKAPVLGNRVTTRGKAKYLGGVGTKVTGIARRQFKPNLQRVRITTTGGVNKTIRVWRVHAVYSFGRCDQASPQRAVQAAHHSRCRKERRLRVWRLRSTARVG